MRILILLLLLTVISSAQPTSIESVEKEINDIIVSFQKMGKSDFTTNWAGGGVKEKYSIAADGKVSYAKFFPAGNIAVSYQSSPGGTIKYSRLYGNGKDAILLQSDGRIIDYTSYWISGQKKIKYQRNKQTEDRFMYAYDEQGRQVYPSSR